MGCEPWYEGIGLRGFGCLSGRMKEGWAVGASREHRVGGEWGGVESGGWPGGRV